MFNPVPPREDDDRLEPERPDRGRRRRYDDDEYPDISLRRGVSSEPVELSTGDILLCVLLSTIGCIVGIVRMAQGDPRGGSMIGISIVAAVVKNALVMIATMS